MGILFGEIIYKYDPKNQIRTLHEAHIKECVVKTTVNS